jgi:glycosyltransferase involved in cell wall biosynthesis
VNVAFSLLTLVPGAVGGSETNVRGLLRAFGEGGGPERLTVLANRSVASAYAEVESERVSLHRVRSHLWGSTTPARLFGLAAARVAPGITALDVPDGLDVIHYPLTVPVPRAKAPSVVSILDLQHHELPHFFSAAERRYRRWAYDGAARGATRVVAISEHTRRAVIEHLGVDPSKVDVIYLGIDLERFSPSGDDSPAERLGLPPRFLFYPANLWPHKNHSRLIEALARLEDREVELVLTGRPFRRLDELAARARECGVGDRVHHLGFVAPDLLPAIYRRAEALVFPSLFEGFGSPPLEAMACGCPAVVAGRGSLPEVCGDAALLFDPEDVGSMSAAVDTVLSDATARARLREAGLRQAQRFSWRAAAEAHHETYRRAVEA